MLEDEVMAEVAVLQGRMQNIALVDMMADRLARRLLPLLVELFEYLREQSDYLHAVLGPSSDVSFDPRLQETVCENLVQNILHEKYSNDPSPFIGYYVAFYAAASAALAYRSYGRYIPASDRPHASDRRLVPWKFFVVLADRFPLSMLYRTPVIVLCFGLLLPPLFGLGGTVIGGFCVAFGSTLLNAIAFLGKRRDDETEAGRRHRRCVEVAQERNLTAREAEVMELLAAGKSLSGVAAELIIAEGTAKAHTRHIYEKLGINARQELLDLLVVE